jgi:hypothetical protein
MLLDQPSLDSQRALQGFTCRELTSRVVNSPLQGRLRKSPMNLAAVSQCEPLHECECSHRTAQKRGAERCFCFERPKSHKGILTRTTRFVEGVPAQAIATERVES